MPGSFLWNPLIFTNMKEIAMISVDWWIKKFFPKQFKQLCTEILRGKQQEAHHLIVAIVLEADSYIIFLNRSGIKAKMVGIIGAAVLDLHRKMGWQADLAQRQIALKGFGHALTDTGGR